MNIVKLRLEAQDSRHRRRRIPRLAPLRGAAGGRQRGDLRRQLY